MWRGSGGQASEIPGGGRRGVETKLNLEWKNAQGKAIVMGLRFLTRSIIKKRRRERGGGDTDESIGGKEKKKEKKRGGIKCHGKIEPAKYQSVWCNQTSLMSYLGAKFGKNNKKNLRRRKGGSSGFLARQKKR